MREDGKIDYVEFPAGDLTAVKAFYATAFGWGFTDYGPAYAAQSSDLLRLLALGVLAKTVTTISFSLARVERRVGRIALVQGVLFALLMGLSWVLMGTLGLNGVGVAYLVTQVIVAAAVLPSVLRALRRP